MTNAKLNSPCHLCGSTSFSRGLLYGYPSSSVVYGAGGSAWKQLSGIFKRGTVHARLCTICGNIQLFADLFTEQDNQ